MLYAFSLLNLATGNLSGIESIPASYQLLVILLSTTRQPKKNVPPKCQQFYWTIFIHPVSTSAPQYTSPNIKAVNRAANRKQHNVLRISYQDYSLIINPTQVQNYTIKVCLWLFSGIYSNYCSMQCLLRSGLI